MMKHRVVKSGNSGLKKLEKELLAVKKEEDRLVILLDNHSYDHCLPILLEHTEVFYDVELLEIESGESSKDISIAKELWTSFLESGVDRNTILVTLGGGVVSDLGGFVASTFKRGIRCLHIPTTLVGMVDAAIGGKVSVNLGEVKNQIGSFYDPIFTYIYTDFLDTLPIKELVSGAAEMIKTALVCDAELWTKMQTQSPIEISRNKEFIYGCIDLKRQIVKKDPFDRAERKALNFGHSIGHALESYCLAHTQVVMSHGEAVAQGMHYEVLLSYQNGGLSESQAKSILTYLDRHYPLIPIPQKDIHILINYLKADKKNQADQLMFSLIEDIGKPTINVAIAETAIEKIFLQQQSLVQEDI